MRRALHARVRPLVERFKNKLLELAAARIDAEVDRIDQALEVALSSYESDTAPDLITAALGPEFAAMMNPAPYNFPERARGFRKLARKGQTSDIPAREEAAESKSAVDPSPVPEADYSSRGAPRASGNGGFGADRDAKPANELRKDGRRKGVTVCSKCGHVGGNARGCGKPTGHPTLNNATFTFVPIEERPLRDRTPVSVSIPPPPVRALKPTAAAIEQHRSRLATLRERSAQLSAEDKPIARAGEDDNPNAEERWTKEEIDEETAAAHARKLSGELPGPISTWTFG